MLFRSADLLSESERRAKVFNSAVKAAAQQIRLELESERDSLAVQLSVALADKAAAQQERSEAWQEAEKARREADVTALKAQEAYEALALAEDDAPRAKAREAALRVQLQVRLHLDLSRSFLLLHGLCLV